MPKRSKRPDNDDQDQFDLDDSEDSEGYNDFSDIPYDQELDFNEKDRPSALDLYEEDLYDKET